MLLSIVDSSRYVSWKVLLLAVCVVVSFSLLASVALIQNAMYSPLNSDALAKKQFHDEMMAETHRYMTSLNSSNAPQVHTPNKNIAPLREFVVLSTTRAIPYIHLFAYSLLSQNSEKDRAETKLTVVNTERPSAKNSQLEMFRNHLSSIQIVDLYQDKTSSRKMPWIERQHLDYIQALNQCNHHLNIWCVIFEEDSLLTRNFLHKFRIHVELELQGKEEYVSFVKLFVTDHWNGFQLSFSHVMEVLALAIACFILVHFFFVILGSRILIDHSHFSSRKKTAIKFAFAYFLLFAGLYGCFRLIGRQHVHNIFEGSDIHLDVCTKAASNVAIAFPHKSAADLLAYLHRNLRVSSQDQTPIDVAIYDWHLQRSGSSSTALETTPSLVQHMGVYSSSSRKNQGMFDWLKQDSAFVY